MDITYSSGPRYIDGINIDADVDASFPSRMAEVEISDVHPYKYYNIELPRVSHDAPHYGPTHSDSLNGLPGPGGSGGSDVTPSLRDLEVRVGNLEAEPNLGYDE